MKRTFSVALVLVVLASLFIVSPAHAAKSYYAERFDVQIDLQDDGSAIVTETIEFHFSGDPFTFAFREISANATDGISFIDASMDGAPMSQGTQAGQVEVQGGDPLKVTWHFSPTSDAAHVFTVRYRAAGVIRKADADTLVWLAVPQDHDYTIKKSTIILTYPKQATPLEQPTLDWNYDSAWKDGRITLTSGGLSEDQSLILTARFPLNSLTQSAPLWQIQQEQTNAATTKALPFGWITGLATLLLGGFGLFGTMRADQRETTSTPVTTTALPPSDTHPAVIGKLTGQQHTFMGAIFDLAQRGILEIHEEKGFWGTPKHILERKSQTGSLNPIDQGLIDALFKPGEVQINLNEVATRLASKNKLFDEPLEQDLIQRRWLDPERKQRKTQLVAYGILGLFLAMVIAFISFSFSGYVLREMPAWFTPLVSVIGLSAGLFLLSIILLIYAGTLSILTIAGEEQSARWKGFAQYLKQVSKGREPAIRPDYFEKYLAYAAVFGIGAEWAKYFQQLGGVPLPVWFQAMAGSNGDFGAMVAVMSASDTAGVSAGAGGAGGASGGGSSGAG